MAEPIALAVVEARRLVRDALVERLTVEDDVHVVVATGSAWDLLEASGSVPYPFQMALVDVDSSRPHSTTEISRLRMRFPQLRIVVVGVRRHERDVVDYIEAGAMGYVERNAPFARLIGTLREIHQGRTSCQPELALRVMERIRELAVLHGRHLPETTGPVAPLLVDPLLTAREAEIAELVAAGLLNKEIARRLGISLATTKNHVHNILNKLRCRNRRGIKHAWRRRSVNGHVQEGPADSVESTGARDSLGKRNGHSSSNGSHPRDLDEWPRNGSGH